MEHAQDDRPELWSSSETSSSQPPTCPHPWAPAPSATDYQYLQPTSSGPSSWLEGFPTSTDLLVGPAAASSEEVLPQQDGRRVSRRSHGGSLSPGSQTTRPNISKATSSRRIRERLDKEDSSRLERKTTKRRKTGPDRFDGYLHGDMPLPLDVTTSDVFKQYPNHVTDEDMEELWRLGLSARQISELMPEETHYNSEGVLVQQHHSLIQKKFKTFRERHERYMQAVNDQAAQQGDQAWPEIWSSQGAPMQAAPRINSGGGQHALSRTARVDAVLMDLQFRYYPFNPSNDKAFEARMSIKIADMEPSTGHSSHPDHEVYVLDLLIQGEFQRHGDLLKLRFQQARTWDFHQASLYHETSRVLLRVWPIPQGPPTSLPTASHALRLLQHTIDQIYLYHPAMADTVATRPIFNFPHRDLRRWRVLARTLYFLVAITRRLLAGPNGRSLAASSRCSQLESGRLDDVDAELGSQTMAASVPEFRPLQGESAVRASPSTASSHAFGNAAYSQAPFSALGSATDAALLSSAPTPAVLGIWSSPTTHGMLSTSLDSRVLHGGIGGYSTQTSLPPAQFPRAPVPRTDFLGPAIPMTTYDLDSEAMDYISFPSKCPAVVPNILLTDAFRYRGWRRKRRVHESDD